LTIFLAIKKLKINIQAEIGNILRGTGISNEGMEDYLNLKTINKPKK